MVKVLIVIKSLGRGGAETLLEETLRIAPKDFYEFHVIYFLPWKNQVVPYLNDLGIKTVCLAANGPLGMVSCVPKLVQYIQEQNIDLVHAHLPLAGLVSRFACRWANVSLIYTEHNKQERYHFLTRILNRTTFKMQKAVIAVSHAVSDSIISNIGAEYPIQTIINGIDCSKFIRNEEIGKSIRSKYGIHPDQIVIGTLAVFREQKKLDLWLRVFRQVVDKYPNVIGILVGDGPLYEKIRAYCVELGLSDKVIFPGFQSDSTSWFSLMDIFLMTSDNEGLPLALLEAMSCECSVVSTAAGGVVEVIQHGVNGFLTINEDLDGLTNFIEALVVDEQLRKSIGVAARLRVIEEFSLANHVRHLLELYERCLE